MKLGEVLADMIRFGDLDEAPWPDEWVKMLKKEGLNYQTLDKVEPELFFRLNVAATLLKLTNGTPGGSCSQHDNTVRPYLREEV